ncbi:MAG: MFS transporter, partial [Candidatus Nitrosopolaris sp.]
LTFYLQNGLAFSPLASGLTFVPMGTGILISSLLTPKIVPKLGTSILKIGTIILIIGYGLLLITAHQESIGLQWSQLLTYTFILGIGMGFVIVPLINIIISHARIENVGAASGVLNTMIAVGNAMGIALIASLFFGMVGVGATSVTSHIGNSNNQVKTHHYTNTLVNSTVCTIGLVLAMFFLIFLLPKNHTKEQSNTKS